MRTKDLVLVITLCPTWVQASDYSNMMVIGLNGLFFSLILLLGVISFFKTRHKGMRFYPAFLMCELLLFMMGIGILFDEKVHLPTTNFQLTFWFMLMAIIVAMVLPFLGRSHPSHKPH